jgi:hypothetical protein
MLGFEWGFYIQKWILLLKLFLNYLTFSLLAFFFLFFPPNIHILPPHFVREKPPKKGDITELFIYLPACLFSVYLPAYLYIYWWGAMGIWHFK